MDRSLEIVWSHVRLDTADLCINVINLSSCCSIAGVLSVTVSGIRHLQSITTGEDKILQLNEVSESDKAAMTERRKDKSTSEQSELKSEPGGQKRCEI
jgi:hypothetical protein